jgi:N-acetylmuramoyl-L-alanine amidase
LFQFRPRSATRRIIVHSSHLSLSIHVDHTAAMRARGREMGLLEIGYHLVIERDGRVAECRPRDAIGSHTPGNNHDSIGVCLAGDAVSGHTEGQLLQLRALVADLMWQFGRLKVVGHTELQRYQNRELRCPHLDMDAFRESIVQIVKEARDAPEPAPPEDPSRLRPQQQLIVDYLTAGRTLTTKVAVVSLGIMSVSSRIAELRKLGFPIREEEATDHFGKRYVKYRLAEVA